MADPPVEITDTLLVSSAAAAAAAALPLSHLDTDRNLNVTVRTLRLYSPTPTPSPAPAIAAALSASLLHYHPLASSLRRRPSDSRLELHPSDAGGVPVSIASSSLTLSSLHASPFLDLLAPDPPLADALSHPLSIQITRLACGELALGMCVHHALFDGAGAAQFLAAVAAIARGAAGPPVEPVWDRASLLGPRKPPRVEVPFHELLRFDHADVASSSPYDSAGEDAAPLVREYFHVSDRCLYRFRARLAEQAGSTFTAFQALGAYIWRARVKAARIADSETVKFVFSMNISNLLKNLALPQGYWGNVCVPVYVKLTVKELLEQEVWETAKMIKESKDGVTEEYVRSYIDFQEINYAKGITAGKGVSAFTDWRHLGHNDVDFGWGGPVAVLPLSCKLLGSTEPCFFLPCVAGDGREKGGFKVLVSLPEHSREAFRSKMKMFAAEEIGSSL